MAGEQVTILGWYGKNNVGDESYKTAFQKLYPEHMLVFTDDSVRKFDGSVVLGGGDVVTDKALDLVKKFSGRKTLFSVNISKERSKEQFAGIDQVVVRDLESMQHLKQIEVAASYAPDVAHVLTPDPELGRRFLVDRYNAEKQQLYKRVVAVVLNANLPYQATERQLATWHKLVFDMAYIADFTSASFVFVPFGAAHPWDDRMANAIAWSKAKHGSKNLMIWDRLDVQTTLNLLSACDAVISTRLHATIFSTMAGVPFIDITHNHKNPAYLRSIGKLDWAIPYSSFDAEKCVSLLNSMITDNECRNSIAFLGKQQKELVRKAAQNVRLV